MHLKVFHSWLQFMQLAQLDKLKDAHATQCNESQMSVTQITTQLKCNATQDNTVQHDTKYKKQQMWQIYLCYLVLIFGPCTDRNRNCEHCAVRGLLLTLWSQHQ